VSNGFFYGFFKDLRETNSERRHRQKNVFETGYWSVWAMCYFQLWSGVGPEQKKGVAAAVIKSANRRGNNLAVKRMNLVLENRIR
jgi:hypothetical protein